MNEPVANIDEAKYWDSEASRHWVDHQDRHDAVLAPLDAHVFGAAAIGHHDRVLDVGCGCGATTRAAARAAGGGEATGIDLSEAMLDRARGLARQDGPLNVRFLHADAQVYPFERSAFDVVISRFGVMFFADPVAAFANLAAATRDGGRLVFVCWQELSRNDWMRVPAAAALEHVPAPDTESPLPVGPLSLADPDRVRTILRSAGWHDVTIQDVREQLPLGADVDEAVRFVGGIRSIRRLLEGVDESTAAHAIQAIRDALAGHETPDGVLLDSAAWLVFARS